MGYTNAFRARYNRPPLSYSSAQQSSAQAWADNGVWAHNRSGQNMWSGTSRNCKAAVDAWADEVKLLRNGDPISRVWRYAGHATQLLDRRTTEMGCGVGRKTVCNYYPAGNVLGDIFYF
ncbi:CAP domain-containing protein [Entophlyctis helioformis]|nr:CAP domain-containing protein [Entophlyctis helioformis]